jgi:hypothetical protein
LNVPRATLFRARQTLTLRAAESAHQIYDQTNQENQSKRAPADDWATKVKSTSAKQQKQNNHE